MLKTFKWLWKMAYNRGQDNAMFEITSMAQYHSQQAQIQAMREKYEPRDDDDFRRPWKRFEYTADQHSAVAKALHELSERLMPPPEPPRQEIMIDPAMMQPPKVK